MLCNVEASQCNQAFISLAFQKLQAVHFLYIQAGLTGAGKHTIIEIDTNISDIVFIEDFKPLSTPASNISNDTVRVKFFKLK